MIKNKKVNFKEICNLNTLNTFQQLVFKPIKITTLDYSIKSKLHSFHIRPKMFFQPLQIIIWSIKFNFRPNIMDIEV